MPTALVTGATSGLGLEFATLLGRDRNDVVLVARTRERLEVVARGLSEEFGVLAIVIECDLSKPGAVRDLLRELEERRIAVDVLVNNAGFGVYGTFASTPVEDELRMIEVNVAAVTALAKGVLPGMLDRGWGRILNVASTAAFQPGPLMAVYYATKAYVLSFTEALAEELSGSGVTVTALCPGPTETGFAAASNMESSRLFRTFRPMSSAKVAAYGYRALQKGKRVAVPGVRNRLMTQSLRVSPRNLVTKVVRQMNG